MSRAPQAPLFVREMGLPARFGLYVLFGLILSAIDTRYAALQEVRSAINLVIQPVRTALALPWTGAREASAFFVTHGELKAENARLRQDHALLLVRQQDRLSLAAENAQLRSLLSLSTSPGVRVQTAEIVEMARDPFSRKVIINRGETHGIVAGRPVVDGAGLVGQVTRVFPLSSEVSLITDAEQAAPVQNQRNGLRVIVSGSGADSLLEVRFLDMHADLKPGDLLLTSGLDGVYPAGIPVARVLRTEPPRHTPFAKALCEPLGGVGRYRHLSVLSATAPAVTPTALRAPSSRPSHTP